MAKNTGRPLEVWYRGFPGCPLDCDKETRHTWHADCQMCAWISDEEDPYVYSQQRAISMGMAHLLTEHAGLPRF